MRKSTAVLACAAFAAIMLAGLARPRCGDATGCTANARSFDADGKPLDAVKAPGKGGTSDHPSRLMPTAR